MNALVTTILKRLAIKDGRNVEVESKKRVLSKDRKDIHKFLVRHKKMRHEKSTMFFDQFLDTPDLDLLRLGASLRLRYKGNADSIYLQYKGPGFLDHGVLFRSEFSSGKLSGVLLEESHHDLIKFSKASIAQIIARAPKLMGEAMRRHLGGGILRRISTGPIVSIYKKQKYLLELGDVFFEPSLDRVFAFHINAKGFHPLSSFCELENELKTDSKSLRPKLMHIPEMLEFDAVLSERFDLKTERHDKYQRCASIFLGSRRKR